MRYIKLQRNFTTSPAWSFASCRERGVWVSLVSFCAEKENSGRIDNCSGWKDREWRALTQCNLKDIAAVIDAKLAEWQGHDLQLLGYDLEGQEAYQKKRESASHGGRKSADSRNAGKETQEQAHAQAHATADAQAISITIPNTTTIPVEEDSSSTAVPAKDVLHLPSQNGGRTQQERTEAFTMVLAEHACATSPIAVKEWWGGLREAGVRNEQDIKEFLTWAKNVARLKGVSLMYWREASNLLEEWIAKKNAEHAEARAHGA
jgi:hypothetical protein